MSESNKQKIEAGAHDFANRFLPVMKELAEEEAITPSWEAEFDKQFMSEGELLMPGEGIDDASDIKAFIQSLLDRKQAEAVALGETLKEKITVNWDTEGTIHQYGQIIDKECEWNSAITTYQKALEALNN